MQITFFPKNVVFRFESWYFFLEITLYQNFNSVYPFNIKTRRLLTLHKMYQSPIYFMFLFKKLLNAAFFFNSYALWVTKTPLSHYYVDLNVWYFYRNLVFSNQGALVNNLSLSITTKTLTTTILNLSQIKASPWTRLMSNSKKCYLNEIRVLPFALKKNVFNNITFLILFILTQPLTSFAWRLNTTYSFVLVSNNINLFIFYSYFYFKIYNF